MKRLLSAASKAAVAPCRICKMFERNFFDGGRGIYFFKDELRNTVTGNHLESLLAMVQQKGTDTSAVGAIHHAGAYLNTVFHRQPGARGNTCIAIRGNLKGNPAIDEGARPRINSHIFTRKQIEPSIPLPTSLGKDGIRPRLGKSKHSYD